jgi:hypothetical protein
MSTRVWSPVEVLWMNRPFPVESLTVNLPAPTHLPLPRAAQRGLDVRQLTG